MRKISPFGLPVRKRGSNLVFSEPDSIHGVYNFTVTEFQYNISFFDI